MTHHEIEYNALDGSKIFAQYWQPEGEPIAVVCQVHGLGEHSGRYAHVAEAFGDKGYAFFGFDHRGHGKSAGARGHIPNYECLMEEIDMALHKIEEIFGKKPVFLYGQSWGGNIVANYLIRRQPPVKGAIIASPWLRLPKEPPAFMVFMGKVMNSVYPAFAQNNGIDPKSLSHDAKVVNEYRNDPLVHSKISARLYFDTVKAAEYAMQHAGELQIPVLLMHGKADSVTSATGTKAFSARVTAPKMMKLYDGLWHELHNEHKKEEVLKDMLDFLYRYR